MTTLPQNRAGKSAIKNLQFALITHSPKNKIKCPNYTRSHSIVIKKSKNNTLKVLKFLVRKIFIIRDNEFLNNMIEQDMYIYITILINFIYSNIQKRYMLQCM